MAAPVDELVRLLGEHTLDDGSHVRLRLIRPEDAGELRHGFDRLSPQSRYRRFLGGVGTLSDAQIRYLTDVDERDHLAIVATRPRPDGSEEGLGVGRFVRIAGEPTIAEAAITVVDEMQHRGLGRRLGMLLAVAARERGIEHFRGEILANNESVRKLLRDVGATMKDVGEDRIVFDVAIDPGPNEHESRELPIRRLIGAAATSLGGLLRHRLG